MPVDRGELRKLWAAAAVLLAGIIAYSQTVALAWDEGFHLLAAQLILHGKRPYLDFLHPQTPLYAYFNATVMRVFGESWRPVHVISSLALVGAAVLTAVFVLERLQDRSWRLAGAMCALILVALNSTELWYGTIAQPYAVCLLLVVSAFRLTVYAVERDSTLDCALAGLCAGGAAACSLLTAPFAPMLLIWTCVYGAARWKKAGAFVGAAAVPFLPLAVLFAEGPRQALFGVFQYHALYRDADWPGAGKQNLDVATAWMNNYEAVLLICLAGLGLTYIVGRSQWEHSKKREFLLCAWLAAAESAYLLIPRPTFGRYYLFVIPFLAILSAVGLYAVASLLGSLQLPWRYPAILGMVMAAAFVKYSVDAWDDYRWSELKPVAEKVGQVTPPGAKLYADEPIYFLLDRTPPPGMEYADSHKLQLPDDVAAAMHVVSTATLDKEVAAGEFATVEICNNDDRVEALGLPGRYAQSAEISDCKIFWDWR
jgi:hypothetical protein